MPYIKIFVHIVWSTKSRMPLLGNEDIRKKVWQHIRENAKMKNIYIDFISGYSDHCHCLISLGASQSIKEVVQMIKGESSFWINKEKLCNQKFNWQDDYFAASVSESHIDSTRNYIKNQENHHKSKTFNEEYNEFLLKHGFKRFEEQFG